MSSGMAACISESPWPWMGSGLGWNWTGNLCYDFQTFLFYIQVLSWLQPGANSHRGWGRDVLSNEWRLCASNEGRGGCTGLQCCPKGKDLSSWQIAKESNGFFSPQQLSSLPWFDSAWTPFLQFVFLFAVLFIPTSPPTGSGFLCACGFVWFCLSGDFLGWDEYWDLSS